jgi:hypothetical protein
MTLPLAFATIPDDRMRHWGLLAEACLLIAEGRRIELWSGGPGIDEERCANAIAAARERGLEWTNDEVRDTAGRLIDEWNGRTP